MSIWKKQVVEIKRRKGRAKGEVTGHRDMFTKADMGTNGVLVPRMVAKEKIPANIYELLRTQNEVDDANLPLEAAWRECIFCGEHATKQRLLNLQTVDLCDEHYLNKSIGRIAQRLRERKEGISHAQG